MSFRLARARRLTNDEPLHLHAVMEESALRRRVGTAETMHAQYQHLVELADQPNVTLQVMRPEDGPHTAVTYERDSRCSDQRRWRTSRIP